MCAERVPTIAVISGRGTNMHALALAARDPDYPAQLRGVIADRHRAPGLDIARSLDVPVQVVAHNEYNSQHEFESALGQALHHHIGNEGLVCLAGFLRILSPAFQAPWQGRMLNIHPSLLPAFKGLHAQRQALSHGVTITGCTVHFVTPDLDSGPIIAQGAVPVLPDDDEATLSRRILAIENRLYPMALRCVADGTVTMSPDNKPVRTKRQSPSDATQILWGC